MERRCSSSVCLEIADIYDDIEDLGDGVVIWDQFICNEKQA